MADATSPARDNAGAYSPLFPLGPGDTAYRPIDADGVKVEQYGDRRFVTVEPEAITTLTREAYADVSHLLRPSHLKQLRSIVDDPEASSNDQYVALELLKNAVVAAGGVLPMCQDTGTALVMGKKGQNVLTSGDDAAAISAGVQQVFSTRNLRFSQLAPLNMFDEQNTKTNLPAQDRHLRRTGQQV